jgi:CubicO group peptidase (beta-lactamase class C family)
MGETHQVTRSPADAGLDADKVEALVERAHREVDAGLLPSCQLALAKDGELVVFEAIGDADTSTRYTIFSSTKPFVASVIWQLLGEGAVKVEQRVAELIPEFGENGKEAITLDQVLQHTSGFPRAPLGPPGWGDRAQRLEAMARWRTNWEPGSQFEYHPTSAHWVLAEVIYAVTGEDHRDAVRRRVTEPLGLTGFRLGGEPGDFDDVAMLELTGEEMTRDEMMAAFGVPEIDRGEVTDDAMMALNETQARVVGIPGGGGTATAADVALFYQALLDDRQGLWDPSVLADVTGTVRNTFADPMFGVPANRTRGLVVAGDDGKSNMRGMGRTVSPRAFGHNGAAGQIAWGDPATGLSFGYLTNGIDRHMLREGRRGVALASLAAVCASE